MDQPTGVANLWEQGPCSHDFGCPQLNQRWLELEQSVRETTGGSSEFGPDTPIRSLGMDSLDVLDFLYRLQQHGWPVPDVIQDQDIGSMTLREFVVRYGDDPCQSKT